MAEAAPTAASTSSVPQRASKRKTALMIAGLLVVEAVVIAGAMWKFMGGGEPHEASAAALQPQAVPDDEQIVETLVLDAKMPNNKSGVTYVYATEAYVQVKKRYVEKVQAEIAQFQNEIKADITAIWRTAEPQHFQEPKLESLTRKVYALLHERFGNDKQHNEPIISKVVIVMSTGFRVDS